MPTYGSHQHHHKAHLVIESITLCYDSRATTLATCAHSSGGLVSFNASPRSTPSATTRRVHRRRSRARGQPAGGVSATSPRSSSNLASNSSSDRVARSTPDRDPWPPTRRRHRCRLRITQKRVLDDLEHPARDTIVVAMQPELIAWWVVTELERLTAAAGIEMQLRVFNNHPVRHTGDWDLAVTAGWRALAAVWTCTELFYFADMHQSRQPRLAEHLGLHHASQPHPLLDATLLHVDAEGRPSMTWPGVAEAGTTVVVPNSPRSSTTPPPRWYPGGARWPRHRTRLAPCRR